MLLTRAHATRAHAALRALSLRFLALRPASIAEPSLANGHAGIALAHAALEGVFPGEGHAARATRALGRATDALATMPLGPSLFSGFAGIAWVVELLHGDPSALPEDDPLLTIDAALDSYLAHTPWTDSYDLVEGLAGLGVYALERLPRPSAANLVARIVEHLEETRERR